MKCIKKFITTFIIIVLCIINILPTNLSIADTTSSEDKWEISVNWQQAMYGSPVKITATYTIKPEDVNSDGTINIDCDPVSMYMAYALPSGTNTTLNLTIKNESGKAITFSDYNFDTSGYQNWGDTYIPNTSTASLEKINSSFYSDGIGQLLQESWTFLSEQEFDITQGEKGTSPTVDTIGFDGKNIRIGFLPCRNVESKPMIALLGEDNIWLTTIQEVDNLVKNEITFTDCDGEMRTLEADSTRTYVGYLKEYYKVSDLSKLTDEQLLEYFDSEENLAGYDSSIYGTGKGKKFLLVSDANDYINEYYKIYGIAGGTRYNSKSAYGTFLVKESDPELQKLAYEYIYKNVIRFSFDNSKYEISNNQNESPVAGNLGLMSYINKEDSTTKMVNEIFNYGEYIKDGESINLPNITSTQIYINAFEKYNTFDFGFSLEFETEKPTTKEVILIKEDEKTNKPIPNTKFAIYSLTSENEISDFVKDADGNYIGVQNEDGIYEITTDENGEIKLNLPFGNYKAVETKAADGYLFEEDELLRTTYFNVEQPTGDAESDSVKINITNKKLLTVTVHHYLENTQNKLIEDEQFKFKEGEYYKVSPSEELLKSYTIAKIEGDVEKKITKDEEVIYYYKIKKNEITTKVELPEGSKEKGGEISGEGLAPYETVDYGNTSVNDIVITPKLGYKVKQIRLISTDDSVQMNKVIKMKV